MTKLRFMDFLQGSSSSRSTTGTSSGPADVHVTTIAI